jgi:hypothetical protein
MMDLVETWIWWDILDAAEIVRFEQKIAQIQAVRQGKVTEEGRKRYNALIHPAGAEEEAAAPRVQGVTDEDIIRYEFKQLMGLREQWAYRRGNDRGFMYVLKRDELPPKPQGELVHRLGEIARRYELVEGLDELDEETRQAYAGEMHVAAEKLTQKAIQEYLFGVMIQIEREMMQQIDRDTQLGPPYNYKERQGEQMDRVLQDLANQLRAILQPAQPAQQAHPAHAAAPAGSATPAAH